MSQKKFCVIGLGYFGMNLSLFLTDEGAEVLSIDKDQLRVEMLADKVSLAVQMDSTDERALVSLGIKDMDAVIVAIGEHFESSINTVAILQELGINKIYARVVSPIHERLLKLMNISELLYPEAEAAEHLANRLVIPGLLESFEISSEFGIFEINVPQKYIGQSLIDVNLRTTYKINLVTVKRINTKKSKFFKDKIDKYEVLGVVNPDYIFQDSDILVLFGKETDFKKLIQVN
jgi:trk system potassium uptake protein TrkA